MTYAVTLSYNLIRSATGGPGRPFQGDWRCPSHQGKGAPTDLPRDGFYGLRSGYTINPATAAAATIAGSGNFLTLQSSTSVASSTAIVGKSMIERLPRTITAPAMVPIAAAVHPSTKATIPGCLPCLRKYGA